MIAGVMIAVCSVCGAVTRIPFAEGLEAIQAQGEGAIYMARCAIVRGVGVEMAECPGNVVLIGCAALCALPTPPMIPMYKALDTDTVGWSLPGFGGLSF